MMSFAQPSRAFATLEIQSETSYPILAFLRQFEGSYPALPFGAHSEAYPTIFAPFCHLARSLEIHQQAIIELAVRDPSAWRQGNGSQYETELVLEFCGSSSGVLVYRFLS
jgi:hypothetical protein